MFDKITKSATAAKASPRIQQIPSPPPTTAPALPPALPDPEELLPHEDASRVYRAMRGKRIGGQKALSLLFVPNEGTHKRRLPRSDLRVQDGAFDGANIIMEFSSMTVAVRGRNLAVVDDGIGDGWVTALEAFNPLLRDMPASGEPFIEKIEFYPRKEEQAARPNPRAKPRLVKTEA